MTEQHCENCHWVHNFEPREDEKRMGLVIDGKKPGTGIECGTLGGPSKDVQNRIDDLRKETERHRLASDDPAVSSSDMPSAELTTLRDFARRAVEVLTTCRNEFHTLATGYDCDNDAHRHNTGCCRCCNAEVSRNKIDALLADQVTGKESRDG